MFTTNEWLLIIEAIRAMIASAQRAQNAKRGTPQIRETYQNHERTLRALEVKISDLAAKAK